MAAASVSRGAVLEKRALNQLNLLADSVQRTVGSQLTGTIDPANPLIDLIIDEIAKDADTQTASVSKGGTGQIASIAPITIDATLNIPSLPADYQETPGDTRVAINLSIDYAASFTRYRGSQWTRITIENPETGIPEIYDSPALNQKEQTLEITSCNITVIYTARQRDVYSADKKTLFSAATYSLPYIRLIWESPAYSEGLQLFNPTIPPTEYVERISGMGSPIEAIYTFDDDETWNIDSVGSIVDGVMVANGRAVSYEKKQSEPEPEPPVVS
jgi:hypothetical protein